MGQAHGETPFPRNWGATSEDMAQAYPCDQFLPEYDDTYWRAVNIDAPAEMVFRWLCQLRVAPYSYDWIDNFGRQSPRQLTPGLDDLKIGQVAMTIFAICSFVPGRHLTLVIATPSSKAVFGELVVTYMVAPITPRRARLVAKIIVRYPQGLLGRLVRSVLPLGDLIMMRKQFLTLGKLAKASYDNENGGETPKDI